MPPQVINGQKIVGESIELAGNRNKCHFCAEGHEFFSKKAAENPSIQYTYYHEGTPQEKEIRGDVDFMPVTRHCLINEKGEKVECRKVDGFSETDWAQLGRFGIRMEDLVKTDTDLDARIEI